MSSPNISGHISSFNRALSITFQQTSPSLPAVPQGTSPPRQSALSLQRILNSDTRPATPHFSPEIQWQAGSSAASASRIEQITTSALPTTSISQGSQENSHELFPKRRRTDHDYVKDFFNHVGNGEAASRNIITYLCKTVGVDVNVKNSDGDTALSIAVCKGDYSLIELLRELGAKPCLLNDSGVSPISLACAKNDLDALRLLVRWDATDDKRWPGNTTPLHLAAAAGYYRRVLCLGPQLTLPDQQSRSLLHAIAASGVFKDIAECIPYEREKPSRDSQGNTLFHYAVMRSSWKEWQAINVSPLSVAHISNNIGETVESVAIKHGNQALLLRDTTRNYMPSVEGKKPNLSFPLLHFSPPARAPEQIKCDIPSLQHQFDTDFYAFLRLWKIICEQSVRDVPPRYQPFLLQQENREVWVVEPSFQLLHALIELNSKDSGIKGLVPFIIDLLRMYKCLKPHEFILLFDKGLNEKFRAIERFIISYCPDFFAGNTVDDTVVFETLCRTKFPIESFEHYASLTKLKEQPPRSSFMKLAYKHQNIAAAKVLLNNGSKIFLITNEQMQEKLNGKKLTELFQFFASLNKTSPDSLNQLFLEAIKKSCNWLPCDPFLPLLELGANLDAIVQLEPNFWFYYTKRLVEASVEALQQKIFIQGISMFLSRCDKVSLRMLSESRILWTLACQDKEFQCIALKLAECGVNPFLQDPEGRYALRTLWELLKDDVHRSRFFINLFNAFYAAVPFTREWASAIHQMVLDFPEMKNEIVMSLQRTAFGADLPIT